MPNKCEPDVAELKRLRREGVSMHEIADHMGVHRATLYRYLRASFGMNPRKNERSESESGGHPSLEHDNHQQGEEDVWR